MRFSYVGFIIMWFLAPSRAFPMQVNFAPEFPKMTKPANVTSGNLEHNAIYIFFLVQKGLSKKNPLKRSGIFAENSRD